MYKLQVKTWCCLIVAGITAAALAGCNKDQAGQQMHQNSVNNAYGIQPLQTEYTLDSNGVAWIPLDQAAGSLGLRHQQDNDRIKMGFTDVMYEAQAGATEAVSMGNAITLPNAPAMINGKLCLDQTSLGVLLNTGMQTNDKYSPTHIQPLSQSNEEPNMLPSDGDGIQRFSILSIQDNKDELVAYAKKFLGVPYEFGAPPYNENKTFDCSTFTQHVFKKFGYSLPRLARQQSQIGKTVSKNNIEVGDLIFFTVPGRFKDDKIAGHVGIYIGDDRFIHTWGEPGVQITSIHNDYWSDMMISIRRLG